MTFTANPDYTWGPKPTVKTITYQYLPDATAAVQAMPNRRWRSSSRSTRRPT